MVAVAMYLKACSRVVLGKVYCEGWCGALYMSCHSLQAKYAESKVASGLSG